MRIVNLATAKARFSELIASVERGEEVLITRHGQPVVRLAAVEQPKRALASRAAFRAKLRGWSQDSVAIARSIRDEGR